jgi:hypothetical protein
MLTMKTRAERFERWKQIGQASIRKPIEGFPATSKFLIKKYVASTH